MEKEKSNFPKIEDYYICGYHSTQYDYGVVKICIPSDSPENANKLFESRYNNNIVATFYCSKNHHLDLTIEDKKTIQELDTQHHEKLFT